MMKALVVLAAATAFAVCLLAIGEHAVLIRSGYELSSMERTMERLITDNARMREKVTRLSSPPVLAERARELGLTGEYPERYAVVRIEGGRREEPLMVRNE